MRFSPSFFRRRLFLWWRISSWLVLICSSLLPYYVDTVGVVLMEGVPPYLEPDVIMKRKGRNKLKIDFGLSGVSKSEGPRSGVNLVDSLLDAECDAISIENKGLGLSNGSEGAVMG
ncbi:unnamed protein product [Lactuca saligna]|uniref:Uncharacterized protein n=1 Tax=Lactuca saligna TaxID=75948 RepID=A0AA35ZF36_LACSI|nr:unnamed protein product [Lactuca saligna]